MYQEILPRYKELAKNSTILWHTNFDLDGNGAPENVYRLAASTCNRAALNYRDSRLHVPKYSYFVIDEDWGEISDHFKKIMRTSGQLFQYQGHSYVTRWTGKIRGGGRYPKGDGFYMSVNRISPGKNPGQISYRPFVYSTSVCSIKEGIQ